MTATIHYSADGKLYHITCDGNEPLFWFSVSSYPGHIGQAAQEKAAKRGKRWINVETKLGRCYHRLVHAWPIVEVPVGRSEPISERHIRFKDYAFFHRWIKPSAPAGPIGPPVTIPTPEIVASL